MFPKNKRWFVLVLFIALLLAGCRCDNSVIPTYFGIGDTPANGEVTSLNPSFNWHGSDTCDPDEYIFRIEEEGKSTQGLVNTNISPSNLPYIYVGGVGSDLEPGKSYTWYLTAVNGANNGDPAVFGSKTEIGQFFTGPVCSGEILVPPQLDYPRQLGGNEEYDNWITHDNHQEFHWSYPGGCLPVSYDYQFALDAGFTTIVLAGTTSVPYEQSIYEPFSNCSSLFWRVAANDGTTVGPWSDTWQFHWVREGTDCYQTHYLSDDFAWIRVSVLEDFCDQTGEIAAWTATLNQGCVVDGMIIVGGGTSYGGTLSDVVVDLGAGPCPSTGLDQKIAKYHDPFGVLTPGTYCVTVSRNQTVDYYGPISMMDGIWTAPRTTTILAEETVTFGPGVDDHQVRFVWDEIDRAFLTYPLDYTFNCRIGPEKICPTYDFAREGETIPILGRDSRSEWMLTQLNGTPCYAQIPGSLIDQYLTEFDPGGSRVVDLGIFHPPDPCPKPETVACGTFENKDSCKAAGCTWVVPVTGALGSCK